MVFASNTTKAKLKGRRWAPVWWGAPAKVFSASSKGCIPYISTVWRVSCVTIPAAVTLMHITWCQIFRYPLANQNVP